MALLALASMGAAAQTGSAPADLIEVYAEALKNNAPFQARLAEFEIISQGERVTHGRLLPQVGLRAGYDYIYEEIEGDYFGFPNVKSDADFGRALFGVGLTQALYRPDLWIEQDQAELRKTQGRFQLDSQEDTLLIAVASAYFAVLGSRDSARFAQAELAAVQRQLDQVRGRFDAGLATEADYQAAKAQQSLVAADLAEAQSRVEMAYAVLDTAAGKPFRNLKVLPEGMVLSRPDPPNVADWIERSKLQNLNVLAARSSLELAKMDYEKARKARWPKVNAAAAAYYLDSGGGVTGEREEVEERIGVQLDLPLYSGGSVTAAIALAEAGTARAQALLDAAVAAAGREAQIAYLDSMAGIARVPALKDGVAAARSAESAISAGFDAGTRTTSEVLEAVEKRFEVERDYAAARYKFMLDSLRLKQAAGNLANADLSQFDRLLRPASGTP
ncbi:MAG: TolC family outer membrane protein [Panacagrimonas sp.]